MFVPKGYVPLTAAVDRLAEARRTAGQTNDDGKNAARAELRDELHSGSMLTTVICPSSGETYKIRSAALGSRKSSDLARARRMSVDSRISSTLSRLAGHGWRYDEGRARHDFRKRA